MIFTTDKTIEILEQTPETLIRLTKGLSSFWTDSNEGEDTWTVYDVIGHLLHGEKTDWIVRTKVILSDDLNDTEKIFIPFDRFAQSETSKDKTLAKLLDEFKEIRYNNLLELKSLKLSETDLAKTGIHPEFGTVTLRQLLSTWAVHDLDHISQIARIMAKQYKEETGPWIEFLKILK